jgi:hypothetical protein
MPVSGVRADQGRPTCSTTLGTSLAARWRQVQDEDESYGSPILLKKASCRSASGNERPFSCWSIWSTFGTVRCTGSTGRAARLYD